MLGKKFLAIAFAASIITSVVALAADANCPVGTKGFCPPKDRVDRIALYVRCDQNGIPDGTGAKHCCDHLTKDDAAYLKVCPKNRAINLKDIKEYADALKKISAGQ